MNTKIIDLIFEHKANIPDKNACICYVANLIDPNPKLAGDNDYILSEIEENYIEFEKHEEKMQLALNFFKSDDAYFAVHELTNLFSWKFSLEYTWKMAGYCKNNKGIS
jgi:hypothetical protein